MTHHLDGVWELARSDDPLSYAGGSLTPGRFNLARQIRSEEPDKVCVNVLIQGGRHRTDGCMAAKTENYAIANDPAKEPGATLAVFKSPYPGIGGSTWADCLSNHTRGIHMDIENEKHTVRESDALEFNKNCEEIKLSQPCRSRNDSTSSSNSRGTKRTRLADEDPINDLLPMENNYDGVKALRSELEEFLYKDSNKINRTAI